MTTKALRDEFAITAMSNIISNAEYSKYLYQQAKLAKKEPVEFIANHAYAYANAMMEARRIKNDDGDQPANLPNREATYLP